MVATLYISTEGLYCNRLSKECEIAQFSFVTLIVALHICGKLFCLLERTISKLWTDQSSL